MRIRFLFRLSEPMRVPDKWPVEAEGVIYSLYGPCDKITAIEATLLKQPLDLAPRVMDKPRMPTISLRHGLLLPRIHERLDHVQCTVGIIFPIEIDMENYEVYFEPENADEESKIPIRKWGEETLSPYINRVSFDIAIKGVLCDVWPELERRAAQFYRRAR
ncbi:MAG: hypothetical protein AB7S93_27390 [Xanthobacteraceae bacterium]